MYDYLKSSGGHSYICSFWYIDATTVHTSHHGALGARECTDESKGLASTDRQLHMFVYVVWCYLSPESRKQCQSDSEIKALSKILNYNVLNLRKIRIFAAEIKCLIFPE